MTRRPRGPARWNSVPGWLLEPIERFLRIESASGIVLLAAAAIALIWANSPAYASYEALWNRSTPGHSPRAWVNDALMATFFLVVGTELRRELHDGALAGLRRAMLPVAAAFGGVAVPAVVYLVATGGDPALHRGWAIPTATDIAFAVGVLTLLGSRVPLTLRVLLLALAIVDDVLAILIIAVFYAGSVEPAGLAIAASAMAALVLLRRLGIDAAWPYLLAGAALWAGLLQAGVHPALAGVVLGLAAPLALGTRLEAALHRLVAFGVMPTFALANAGVHLGGIDWQAPGVQLVFAASAAGLVIGKPVGVLAGAWVAVRLGLCELPRHANWSGIAVVGILAGIGFTMAMFIANLAFAGTLLSAAKLGVLAASAVAAALGLIAGRLLLAAPAASTEK